MTLSPEVMLQLAVLLITGLNALAAAKTATIVYELRSHMYENFVTKKDLALHLAGRQHNHNEP